MPTDSPGGAQGANLTQAAVFAWQEFIALNWPAAAGTRETPDMSQSFGQNATAGGSPLVWETMRAKVELFPGNGNSSQGPHGWELGPPNYGYDEPPAYIYKPLTYAGEAGTVGTTDGKVAACPGQQPPAQPNSWLVDLGQQLDGRTVSTSSSISCSRSRVSVSSSTLGMFIVSTPLGSCRSSQRPLR